MRENNDGSTSVQSLMRTYDESLAFRLNTYETCRIKQKVLESLCQRKENFCYFFSIDNQPLSIS